MIGKLRKKVQTLEIALNKEKKSSSLLDALQALSEDNIPAQTLMQFLHYIFTGQSELDQVHFAYLKELFEISQYRLIEAYETRIGTLNQMNNVLVTQLREQNFELQQAYLKDEDKLNQLQAHDKILQQYILEEEAKENIFDWIRDFKDYEIRRGLQSQIDGLITDISERDQKIMDLQLKIEDMIMQMDNDLENDNDRNMIH